MTEPPQGGCCKCVITFIFTSGLTALFLWLSLRVSNPICSIEHFDVFALSNTSNNNSIYYDLKLNNKNKDKGIYYDALNLTFYYKPYISLPIANATINPFDEGRGKFSDHKGNVAVSKGVKWEKDATEAVAKNKTAVFRVELITNVRFKIIFWKTKRRHLVIGADLPVDDQGSMIKKKKNKGIKLTSSGTKIKRCFKLLGLFGVLFFILVW